jgi:hypothetical protein
MSFFLLVLSFAVAFTNCGAKFCALERNLDPMKQKNVTVGRGGAWLARFLAASSIFRNFVKSGDGERQDEQKRPANERYPIQFSVLQPELGHTAAGVLAFDSHRGTPVETLPAVNAPNGRSEHRAERSIVRLPIDRIIKQATKEPKA